MRLHVFPNYKQTFCQYRFPGQWVVVTCVPYPSEEWDKFEYIQRTCVKLGMIFEWNLMPDEDLYIVCDTEEEARQVYNLFPQEKAGYTVLFGPVQGIHRKHASAVENERGMILTENT